MEVSKRNPDELLKHIEEIEDQKGKGHLKIFFGYAAGVGKTYTMLEAAHDALAAGVDVVVGERLVANYPILIDYALPNLTGYLFLEPIGKSIERYRTDPALLAKYFKLFYIYSDQE